MPKREAILVCDVLRSVEVRTPSTVRQSLDLRGIAQMNYCPESVDGR
jgi:hypothetical protein